MDVTVTPRRGRPPRTEHQRAAQRARLVEGAMEAIRQRGAEVPIDEMAATAGVSKPVLYDEFGGKLGIADAIAVELARRLERQVLDELAARAAVDLATAIEALIGALVDLIEQEPQLYAFLARSLRNSDRRFLDNALVQVIHERASLLLGSAAPGVPEDHLAVLTDGAFGFVFAAVESWQTTHRPAKAELVRTLTTVLHEGVRGAATRLLDVTTDP